MKVLRCKLCLCLPRVSCQISGGSLVDLKIVIYCEARALEKDGGGEKMKMKREEVKQ